MGIPNPGDGGAIHVSGSVNTVVVVDGSTIQGNVAANQGGGIWNPIGSKLVVRNSMIAENSANGSSSSDGGGGIYNAGGILQVTNSSLVNNSVSRAQATGGADSLARRTDDGDRQHDHRQYVRARRRWIAVDGGNLVITNSNLSSNLAATINVGNGGGLLMTGTAIATISGTDFINNQALRSGGGLWNAAGATTTVQNSTFAGNVASGAAFGDGGGGLYNAGGTVQVINSTIASGSASGGFGAGGGLLSDGGSLTVQNSTVSGNTAVRAGGGIELMQGFLRVQDSTIGGSSASSGNTAGLPTANPGDGGGIHVYGTQVGNYVQILTSTIQNNVAYGNGGGLWNQTNATMIVRDNSQVLQNRSLGNLAFGGGGGAYNNGGTLRMINSTVSENRADGTFGGGGGILSAAGAIAVRDGSVMRANVSDRAGGAIEIINGSAYVANSTLGGPAPTDGNIAGDGPLANGGYGGAISVTGTTGASLIVDHSTLQYNRAKLSGGAIWNAAQSIVRVRNGSALLNNRPRTPGNRRRGRPVRRRRQRLSAGCPSQQQHLRRAARPRRRLVRRRRSQRLHDGDARVAEYRAG